MRRTVLATFVLGVVAALTPKARALVPCCPVPVCPPVCYKIECIPVKCIIQVPKCVPEPRTVQICIPITRWIDREVACVRYVRADCVDSCGHVRCCYRPEHYTKVVKCPVTECRYEPRQIITHRVVYEPREVIRHVYRCVPVACPPMPPAAP